MDVEGQAPVEHAEPQPPEPQPTEPQPDRAGSRALDGGHRDLRRPVIAGAGVVALLVVVALVVHGLTGGSSPSPTGSPAPSGAPSASASAPDTGGSPTGPGLLGVSVPKVEGDAPDNVVAGLRGTFGKLPVVRVFESKLPPANWDADPTLAALGTGSAVVYSFKGNVANAATGAFDARITAFLASKPAGIKAWVVFHHEPEDDIARGEYTAADFVAATTHLAPVIRAAGGIPTEILQSYTLRPDSGRDWHTYYSPAVDVFGWDGYNSARRGDDPSYKAPKDFLDPVLAVAKETGKPFGFGEFGSPCIRTDPSCSGRAAWITAMGKALRAAGAQFGIYWNQKTDVDFTLKDAGSVDAWKTLVAS